MLTEHQTARRCIDAEEAANRYLHIVDWAKRRYAVSKGPGKTSTATFVGTAIAGRPAAAGHWGVPTRFTVIEDMAAARYLDTDRLYPDETLATAYRP